MPALTQSDGQIDKDCDKELSSGEIPSDQVLRDLRLFVDFDLSFDQHCLCIMRKFARLVSFSLGTSKSVILCSC